MAHETYWDLISECEKGKKFIEDKFRPFLNSLKANNRCLIHRGPRENNRKYKGLRLNTYTYVKGRREHKIVLDQLFSYMVTGKTGKIERKCGNSDCVNPYHFECHPITSWNKLFGDYGDGNV